MHNLSNKAQNEIAKDPFLKEYLEKEYKKFPLPPNYVPMVVEVLIDNTLVTEKSEPPLNPILKEVRFDGECAFFKADGVVLIDRIPENLK